MKHQYLIENQVYKLKSLIKNDQLLEVDFSLHAKLLRKKVNFYVLSLVVFNFIIDKKKII